MVSFFFFFWKTVACSLKRKTERWGYVNQWPSYLKSISTHTGYTLSSIFFHLLVSSSTLISPWLFAALQPQDFGDMVYSVLLIQSRQMSQSHLPRHVLFPRVLNVECSGEGQSKNGYHQIITKVVGPMFISKPDSPAFLSLPQASDVHLLKN